MSAYSDVKIASESANESGLDYLVFQILGNFIYNGKKLIIKPFFLKYRIKSDTSLVYLNSFYVSYADIMNIV